MKKKATAAKRARSKDAAPDEHELSPEDVRILKGETDERELEEERRLAELGAGDPIAIDSPELIDPNAVIEAPGREYGYVRIPGIPSPIRYDKLTLVVEPVSEALGPLKLPKPFSDVAQPFVQTCTLPVAGVNMGCHSASTCPFRFYHWLGTFNVIIHLDGRITFCSCHEYWHGLNKAKRPTSNIHYRLDGYDILLDRTTVPVEKAVADKDGKLIDVVVEEFEVPNLGPMYWALLRKKGLAVPEWKGAPPKPQGGRGVLIDVDAEEQRVRDYMATHPVSGQAVQEYGRQMRRNRESGRMQMRLPGEVVR